VINLQINEPNANGWKLKGVDVTTATHVVLLMAFATLAIADAERRIDALVSMLEGMKPVWRRQMRKS
jgi:hypothetical protein